MVKHCKHTLKCIAGYFNLCKYSMNLNIITFNTTTCVVLYWGHRCPMGGGNGSAFLFTCAVLFPPPCHKPTQSSFLKFVMRLTQITFMWKEWVNSSRRIWGRRMWSLGLLWSGCSRILINHNWCWDQCCSTCVEECNVHKSWCHVVHKRNIY